MFAVPVATPVTTPEELTVAIPVAPLLHAPPVDVVVSVTVVAGQSIMGPVIALGNGFTVIVRKRMHPFAGCVYEMTAVPALLPETMPVDAPTGAFVALLDVHVPPVGLLEYVTDPPTQILFVAGVNIAGCRFTVTERVM